MMAQLAYREKDIETYRRIKLRFADNCGFKINGQTNVSSFECACEDKNTFKDNEFFGIVQKDKIDFQKAILNIPVQSIGCGNRVMNSDLYELLNESEYPFIKVHFLEANWNLDNLWKNEISKEQIIGYFDVVISISGVSKNKKVYIHQSEVDQENAILTTSGEVSMHLSDFDIEPPVKFMGLVKVKEQINLELDLVFHWAEISSISD